MRARDKAIIEDIARFRCLTRDHVAAMHFDGLKRSVTQANMVLKRLRRDKYVTVSTERRKYLYFPSPATIKKDSAKIPHYLAIADFYTDLCRHSKPLFFDVEPKLGEKGYPEPDAFMSWRAKRFFVEIQRTPISDKDMLEKINAYEDYYNTGEWRDAHWQRPSTEPFFPRLWVISDRPVKAEDLSFRLHQTRTVDELISKK